MSEKLISPGAFTRESDRSFLTTGISQIGAVIIGPTEMGPAFIPTPITNANDFQFIFGDNSDNTYVPYTVKSYLKNAGMVHVVRVLGTEGWKSTFNRTEGQNNFIKISLGNTAAAVLALTATEGPSMNTSAISVTGSGSAFVISSGSVSVSCSFDKSSPNYILKVLGNDPNNRFGNDLAKELYCYQLFENFAAASYSLAVSASTGNLDFVTNAEYSAAETSWIQSQLINGQAVNLFKFVTISDGINSNKKVKVVIDNVTKPKDDTSYGTFNVLVRDYNDTDNRQNVLETFANCTLDPNSKNYVVRMIGDKYKTIDSEGRVSTHGENENRSKYIRIVAAEGLASIPNTIVPFGHSAYFNPVVGTNFPVVPMVEYQGPSANVYNSRYNWGIDLTKADAKQFSMPIMDGATENSLSSFNLDNKFGHPSSSYTGSLSGSNAPSEMLSYTVVFQGGWDGIPPNRLRFSGDDITASNVFGFDCSGGSTPGTVAFKKAIDSISNPDEYDMNMLIIPGILQNLHSYVVDHAINLCEDRQDTFLIFDCAGLSDSIDDAVESVSGIDSNYAATYFPWVKINDSQRNKSVWVPPSVVMAGVIAFNDRISAAWYAPAGLNRGGLTDVIDVKMRLTNSDKSKLYQGRVNPIAIFPGQGPSAWGQKTLQQKASALDRINVRRLLIELKKFFASTAKYIVFEPNTNQTREQFLQIVIPYMDSVKRKSGVYAYKIVMDETNNTADVIDRNMLVGSVYIQPTKAAEYIELTFNILPTGAVFE